MNLIFVTEARFHRGVDGKVYSPNSSFGPLLWKKYLQIFDKIYVLARVELTKNSFPKEQIAENDQVNFVEIPYYIGPWEYLKKRSAIKAIVKDIIKMNNVAYICRVPGQLGTIVSKHLIKEDIPYAVEVVGDPWDVFSPSSFKHSLSFIFRILGYLNLRKVVLNASAALYVTKTQLQSRYKTRAGIFTTNASNVYLPDMLFSRSPKINVKKTNDTVNLIAIASLASMHKCPDIVLRALKDLKDIGINFHLRWLGDGIYRIPMINYANELGLNENVVFLGNITSFEEVLNELIQSDLFIHASSGEGLPRVVIEAMSVGLPCIATNVNGTPELLNKSSLVPPRNVPALVNKIQEFISNPILMNAEGIRNFEKSKEYSDSILKRRREEFYHHIVKISSQ